MNRLSVVALPGLPEVRAGDDLGALIAQAGATLRDGDVVCVAHKVVSKSEGRVRRLAGVEPGERARELAARLDRDPRHVQVVLDEAAEVMREERALICRTSHGFVCANAGVDASNAGDPDAVVLLPEDPDASARALRARLRELTGASPAVVISDSFGRAWRHGQAEVAIGCAGLAPLDDWRGRADRSGRALAATWIAVADEAAAAADLARGGKDSGEPVVLIRGLGRFVTEPDGPGAATVVRPVDEDLFPVSERLDAVRRIHELWRTGRDGVREGLIAQDVAYVNPFDAVDTGERHGLAGWSTATGNFLSAFEIVDIEVVELREAGERVLALVDLETRARGSGLVATRRLGWIFEFRDGRVVRFEWHNSHDEARAAFAAG